MKRLVVLALCFVFSLCGCSSSGENRQKPDGIEIPGHHFVSNVSNSSSLQRAKSVFEIIDTPNQNVLYSPVSLEMALGLVTEGAGGETKAQLVKLLGVDDYSSTASSLFARADAINVSSDSNDSWSSELTFANSIWLNKGYSLTDEYSNVVTDSYRAKAETLDFADGDVACQTINDWCNETTRGLVPKIVDSGSLNPDLVTILCNSVYFRSGWEDKWTEREGIFTNYDGSVTELSDMLYNSEDLYYETSNAVAFGKPYKNGSMFIGILPNEDVSIKDIDLDVLLKSKTNEYIVHCSMPKLNYDYSYDSYIDVLKTLGVTDAFELSSADFSKMINETQAFAITDIIQKCKIELDAEGTKAAAVTVVNNGDGFALPSNEPEVREVHLNRPFYYLIFDEETNQVLFIGAVNTIGALKE